MARRNKKKIFSIIITNHGKQKYTVVSETTEAKIYREFNNILDENKKILFPQKYNNEQHVMVEADYELVIIKCKQEGDSDVNKVRDEYGKFIDYESSDEDWIIIDRAPYYIEETFWVYGYHPRIQRKNCQWILDNFISKDCKDKTMFKTVQIFKNKLIVECNGNLEIIICKNKSDSIRLYNTIEEYSRNNKYKYIAFMGDVGNSKYKLEWIDRLQTLTGWSRKKIERSSTRP